MVRGVVNLPNGTGRTVRVAVFARGPKADEAKAAGADGGGAVAQQLDIGSVALIVVGRDAVDVDELALALRVPQRGVVFHRIEPHRDDDVRFVEQAVGRLVVEQPDAAAEAVEPVARHDARGLIGAGDRQPRPGE